MAQWLFYANEKCLCLSSLQSKGNKLVEKLQNILLFGDK